MQDDNDEKSTELADKARLEFTLSVRESIIKDLFKDNKIPDDKADKELLIKALDGMDRTVLSRAKLKVEDANAKSQRNTTRMIADLLTRVTPRSTLERTEMPRLSNDIVIDDIVPGETEIGDSPITLEDILG